MHDLVVLLLAVAAGWVVQLWMTYRQSTRFNRVVIDLRTRGRVAVGVAGNRYRGGRAFVALAVDPGGVVRDAVALQGWTTLAGARPLPALVGAKVARVQGAKDFPQLSRQQREAARQAAGMVREAAQTRT